MEHATVLVREYDNQQDFTTDEQKLGQEGWSVQSTVNPFQQQGVVKSILGRFTRKPAQLVVTYHRERPSRQ